MGIRLFSDASRPVHLGPFPMERLSRGPAPDWSDVPRDTSLTFQRPEDPVSIINAMADYQAMMDAIRDGFVNRAKAECPDDVTERANHLKAFG
ncbi:MAG TPA: hypothetical protein VJ928_08520, partial [Marivita sp.]|nr:hypothetical protein [Marivita sp.]